MSTHSRSFLLVQKEITRLQEDTEDIQIVTIDLPTRVLCLFFPLSYDDNWKEGKFYLNVIFPENFNDGPPSLRFLTIPFHPNIHPETGECSLTRLTNWNSQSHVVDAIRELQDMLSYPEMKTPSRILNKEAMDLINSDANLYNAMAKQCSRNSQKLGDLMAAKNYAENCDLRYSKVKPFRGSGESAVSQKSQSKEIIRQVAFEDYQAMWSKIGTTKTSGKRQPTLAPIPDRRRTSRLMPRDISTVESESSRIIRTALKLKLDTLMTPGRAPSPQQLPITSGRAVAANTPRGSSPLPLSKSLIPNTHSSAAPFSLRTNDPVGSIGVTMIERNREIKDFSSQVPSLPASQEKQFRFRTDDPIFDNKLYQPVLEAEATSLLQWSQKITPKML